jgi:hypothetical protein
LDTHVRRGRGSATDADVSIWWLTFVRALLKVATDVVLLKR